MTMSIEDLSLQVFKGVVDHVPGEHILWQVDQSEGSSETPMDDSVFVCFENEGHVLASAKNVVNVDRVGLGIVSAVSGELSVSIRTVDDDRRVQGALAEGIGFFDVEIGERNRDGLLFRNSDVDSVVLVWQVSIVTAVVGEDGNGPGGGGIVGVQSDL